MLPATVVALVAALLASVSGSSAQLAAFPVWQPPQLRPAVAPAVVAQSLPQFSATVRRIGPKLRERMTYSHHAGCPLRLRQLRYVRMTYVSFGGSARTGEMVVRRRLADDVVTVFHSMYAERFPIRRMRLVDDYEGDDGLSMSANNTSAYNCRRTINGDRWSEHSYGRAIDINPVQNPYVDGSFVAPEEGRKHARIDRSADASYRKGAIRSSDVVVDAFRRIRWEWGGDWQNSKDYQHFSSTGL